MKTIIISCFCLLLGLNSYAQNEKSLTDVVLQIADQQSLASSSVGFAGTVSPQYKLLNNLKTVAKPNDLLELMNHESVMVNINAYWALEDKSQVNLSDYFKNNPEKNTTVFYQNGCLMMVYPAKVLMMMNPSYMGNLEVVQITSN